VAFLSWRFGLTQMTAWRIEVAPFPDLSNMASPTKAIITITITLYGYENGDDAEVGGPEGCARGWSMSLLLSPKGQTRRLQRRALSALYFLYSRCIQPQRFAHHAYRASSSLCRSVSSCRSLGDERGPRVFATSALSTLL
jgi:hypothetical protein